MTMNKICHDTHTSPRNLLIKSDFMAMVSHWLRAVINHWIWGAPSCRRGWSRVFVAGYNAKELILAPEVGTEAKALSEWFFRNPGCVRLIGGIMLRYFREPVIDDLTYIETI